MRKFVDPNGGLEVEKYESKEVHAVKSIGIEKANKKLPMKDMVETLDSYQLPMFTENKSEKGGSECLICGKKTSYDNRHICVNCWSKYNKKIIEKIKEEVIVSEIEI